MIRPQKEKPVDKAFVQSQIDAAGPTGHLVVSFRDYLVPVLDENGEAVKDELGETVHAQHPLGHVRTVSGFPTALIDTHLGIGAGPGKPIFSLIAFTDIDRIHPDAGELPAGNLAPVDAPAPAPPEPTPEPPLEVPPA
jgi:hypothetical protein